MTASNSLPDPTIALAHRDGQPIFAAFIKRAGEQPQKTAVESVHGVCTYDELERISRGLAQRLVSRDLGHGDRVAIIADRGPALIYAMIAASRAGSIFCLIDASYPAARIATYLRTFQPSVVLLCDESAGSERRDFTHLPAGYKIVSVPAQPAVALKQFPLVRLELESAVDSAKAAYVTFTSGSTGEPKGVVASHAPLTHFVEWHAGRHGLTIDDRFSMLSGIGHDPLYRDVFTPLSIGATLVVPSRETLFDPHSLVHWLRDNNISVVHLTPPHGELIEAGAAALSIHLPQVRWFFWGGDRLYRSLARRIKSLAPNSRQVNFYGATETPQAMGYFDASESDADLIPIGRGIEDVQILVVDDNEELAGIGVTGEIWVRSPYLAIGYLGDESQTHAKFLMNPFTRAAHDICYRTGDLGYYQPDGNVVLAGRRDHQVKIRGFRVEPAEVALNIERVPGVARAVVIANSPEGGALRLVAYFTSAAGFGAISSADMRASLESRIPDYMIPASICHIDAFPLTPNGKIDIARLPEADTSDPEGGALLEAPANDREREMVTLWKEVLGVPEVGVTSSFASLGGDSLSAMRAIIRMRRFGIAPEVARGILQGKTIRQLCASDPSAAAAAADSSVDTDALGNLHINIVRGVLLLLNVLDHWMPGLLARLPAQLSVVQSLTACFFNMSTPGFAIVFGLTLGKTYFPKYAENPVQTRRLMRSGAGLLIGGNVALVAMSMAANGIPGTLWDLIASAYGPLQYYILALCTAPFWFDFIGVTSRRYIRLLALGAGFLGAYQLFLWTLGDTEGGTAFYALRLLTVAKFSYLNMSVGALIGVAGGVFLSRGNRAGLSGLCFRIGIGGLLFGAVLLLLQEHSLKALIGSGDDMGLWRWVFFGGGVALLAALSGFFVDRIKGSVQQAPFALKLIGVLGQCTFPIFVLHLIILPLKHVLMRFGLSDGFSLLLVLIGFIGVCSWLVLSLYRLYYGESLPATEPNGIAR